MLRALLRPPCLVSFSGGRDSSLVLAIASDVARRHGLPLPVPATNRFPGRPETDESGWQELVIVRTSEVDWLRLDWGEELDIVGPYARLALRRHGILAPFNSHFHLPLIQLARGGSMLTGIGGDELLSPVSREVAAAILMRRRLPGRGELPALALALAPRPLRTAVIARRRRVFRTFGWLTSTARRRVALAYASWESRDPLRWDVASAHGGGEVGPSSAIGPERPRFGLPENVQMLHPLCEPEVLAATARAWGRVGPAGRQAALGELAGESLPARGARDDKAWFDRVFWAGHSRRLARAWNGEEMGSDPGECDRDSDGSGRVTPRRRSSTRFSNRFGSPQRRLRASTSSSALAVSASRRRGRRGSPSATTQASSTVGGSGGSRHDVRLSRRRGKTARRNLMKSSWSRPIRA